MIGLGLGLNFKNSRLPDAGADGITGVDGLELWLKNNTGLTIDSGVPQWDDQSGNGRHYTQTTAVNQPANLGSSGLGFDGVNTFMEGTSFSLTDYHVFMVLKINDAAASEQIFGAGDGGNSGRFWKFNAGFTRMRHGGVNTLQTGSTSVSMPMTPNYGTNKMLLEVVRDTGAGSIDVEARFDGATVMQGRSNTTNAFTFNILGAITTIPSTVLNGEVGEYVVFNRKLVNGDYTTVKNELIARNGL